MEKESLRKRLTEPLIRSLDEMDDLYFCGIGFLDYLAVNGLFRFQQWLGFGLCSEMSVLSMLLLKHIQTTKLCQGTYYDLDGSKKDFHCWVEFSLEGHEYVADFTWNNLGLTWIASKDDEYDPDTIYIRESEDTIHLKDGGKLVVDWSISHDEFWEYELSKQLYEKMQAAKTSYVFNDLVMYAAPETQKGFIIDKTWRSELDGRIMIPYYRCGRPMSAVIIKYFVGHPDEDKPSDLVIKRTEDAIKKLKKYMEQQNIAEI